MARVLKVSPNQSVPENDLQSGLQINQEQLIECLRSSKYMELNLREIQERRAICTGTMYYRITAQTRAKYDFTISVPLEDRMFDSEESIRHIQPSIAAEKIEEHQVFQFQFISIMKVWEDLGLNNFIPFLKNLFFNIKYRRNPHQL